MNNPLLGVIGGMGTKATACFYEKFHALQNVVVEQDYFDVLIYSKPSIPDRTAFITGNSTNSPLDSLIHAARTLESAGVSCIAIPCITSHYFYEDIAGSVAVPVLNLLDETASCTAEREIGSICLLATDGTIKGNAFNTAYEKYGINVNVPPQDVQANLMEIVYNIKRGACISHDFLDNIKQRAFDDGAEAIVLGCTELCIVSGSSSNVINTLDVLAEASLKKMHKGNSCVS